MLDFILKNVHINIYKICSKITKMVTKTSFVTITYTKKCFSVDQYQDDINTENPLGTGGKLAVIFANLMRNLWSGKERSLSPYKLKVRIYMYMCMHASYNSVHSSN